MIDSEGVELVQRGRIVGWVCAERTRGGGDLLPRTFLARSSTRSRRDVGELASRCENELVPGERASAYRTGGSLLGGSRITRGFLPKRGIVRKTSETRW